MFKKLTKLSFIIPFFLSSSLFSMEPKEQCLPTLSTKDMEASFGSSNQHASWTRLQLGNLHETGDTWEDEKLQNLFCAGLFQHYFHQFTYFDYEKNPIKDLKNDIENGEINCKNYGITFNFKVHNRISGSKVANSENLYKIFLYYQSVGDTLKNHAIYRQLGASFLRLKIQVEKKGKELNLLSDLTETKELTCQELLKIDRNAVDCQTLLFHWMKKICDDAREKVINWNKKLKELEPQDATKVIKGLTTDLINEAAADVINTNYDFLSFPVYKEIIDIYGKGLIFGVDHAIEELKISVPECRSKNELTGVMVGIMEFSSHFEELLATARKAFDEYATDEDMTTYGILFEGCHQSLSEICGAQGEEVTILQSILSELIMERVIAGKEIKV